ncbi:MAG TPA: hypothetical protein VMI33_15705 [Streptosporangiaceae bacterium]|nr:hypothetical protein [Streptosporangiaceae bacterium]
MDELATRHGQVGFRRVQLPVGFCQQPSITAENGTLIQRDA